MPHVLDDTDTLEHPSPSPTGDALHALQFGLPASQGERSRFLALLRHLLIPAPRLRTRRQEHCALGAPRFETPLDILAREYPDLHLQVIAGMG